jgi:hypothetical protein
MNTSLVTIVCLFAARGDGPASNNQDTPPVFARKGAARKSGMLIRLLRPAALQIL